MGTKDALERGIGPGKRMDRTPKTFSATTEPVEVALLDAAGVVVSVNDAWTRFGLANGAAPDGVGLGASYLEVCAAAGDDPHARQAGAAVRSALTGDVPAPLHVRFPCDAPGEKRWFEMLVSSRFDDQARCIGATVTITPALPPRLHPQPRGDERGSVRPGPRHSPQAPPPRVPDARVEAVLEAHAAVLAAHQVTPTARRLVRAACDLVRADHGTLGVLGPDGTFTRFLDDVAESGFRGPANAPRGGEVLAVSVPVRTGTFGILYLTRRGPGGFDEAEERLVRGLALATGTAIDNARMHEDNERRRAWQSVSTLAVRQLFAADDHLPLETVLRLAMHAADADFAALAALTEAREVVVEEATGAMEEAWLTTRRPLADSLVAAVLSSGTPVLVDLSRQAVPDADGHRGIRSVMGAPLVRRGGRVAALVVGRRTGREAFDRVDLEHLTAYAGYAGSALDVHRARDDREKLLLLEEHERIAADLHGQIVQDLFSTGMGMQGLVPEIASREVRRRLLGYVDALDATIHRIRSTVFEQQERRHEVDAEVDEEVDAEVDEETREER